MSNILTHFTGTPRQEQRDVLLELEASWNYYEVFVLRMPVGSGKSRVAHCLASWLGARARGPAATILTPTNVLVRQYLDDWPTLPSLARADTYRDQRAYASARATCLAAPTKILNYYAYLAHRAYSPTVIVDEAHNLVPFLQDKEAVKVWLHLDDVPDWVRSTDELAAVAARSGGKRMAALRRKLSQHPDTYVVERANEPYRGHDRDVIKLLPLTPRNNRPILWPPYRVKKLVFMSATFHAEDLYDLGLEGRRVKIIDCASPIPAANRPVVYAPVGSMGMGGRAATLPRMLDAIERLLATNPERGLIHATYGLAAQLRASRLGNHPRLVWHNRASKERVFRQWLAGRDVPAADGSPVLVGSGFTEGIDLAHDRARWQAITKLMYPDRSETAVAAKAAQRPDWYAWMAARDLQQAVGRVSRGADDFGRTYILTSEFGNLYSSHRDMFVPSFHEALDFGSV